MSYNKDLIQINMYSHYTYANLLYYFNMMDLTWLVNSLWRINPHFRISKCYASSCLNALNTFTRYKAQYSEVFFFSFFFFLFFFFFFKNTNASSKVLDRFFFCCCSAFPSYCRTAQVQETFNPILRFMKCIFMQQIWWEHIAFCPAALLILTPLFSLCRKLRLRLLEQIRTWEKKKEKMRS